MAIQQLSPAKMIRERGRLWELGPCYMDRKSPWQTLGLS